MSILKISLLEKNLYQRVKVKSKRTIQVMSEQIKILRIEKLNIKSVMITMVNKESPSSTILAIRGVTTVQDQQILISTYNLMKKTTRTSMVMTSHLDIIMTALNSKMSVQAITKRTILTHTMTTTHASILMRANVNFMSKMVA